MHSPKQLFLVATARVTLVVSSSEIRQLLSRQESTAPHIQEIEQCKVSLAWLQP